MCGRFSLSTSEKQVLLDRFGLKNINIDIKPRYNIAPSQMVPIIRNDSLDTLTEAKWGLIPSWAKDESLSFKMINARSETIAEKPAYRSSFKNKRCLIPADSFYEWNKKGGTKTPYRIMLENEEIFSFAGIFDEWKNIVSCSIATTEPNELIKKIHIRMPVILKKEDEKKWLESDPENALKLLKPFPGKMKMYEISTKVNTPANNTEDIIKPIKKSTLSQFM